MGMAGNDIADGAGLHMSEFQQPEDLRRQSLLGGGGPAVEFCAGGQGIDTFACFGNVGGAADEVHIHLAGAAHQLILPAEDLARFQTRPQVQSEDGLHTEGGEQAAVAEVLGAAGAFLAGLEHQQYIPVKLLFLIQPAGQLQEDGHMAVVAAGMHPARMAGGEIKIRIFFNGQAVAVCPEGDGALCTEVEKGAEAALHRGEDPTFQSCESRGQVGHGLRQIQLQLRDFVQLAPIAYDLLHGMPPR